MAMAVPETGATVHVVHVGIIAGSEHLYSIFQRSEGCCYTRHVIVFGFRVVSYTSAYLYVNANISDIKLI